MQLDWARPRRAPTRVCEREEQERIAMLYDQEMEGENKLEQPPNLRWCSGQTLLE